MSDEPPSMAQLDRLIVGLHAATDDAEVERMCERIAAVLTGHSLATVQVALGFVIAHALQHVPATDRGLTLLTIARVAALVSERIERKLQ